jgi:hypothetical protein
MDAQQVHREVRGDGSTILRAGACTFVYRRTRAGVLDVRIDGADNGQFGTATLDEIAMALVRERPLELFIDASAASMPSVPVSRDWARFFTRNRTDLKRVSVLVSSRTVELTIAIAQHLSQTGKLIQIYTDAEVFEARRAAVG